MNKILFLSGKFLFFIFIWKLFNLCFRIYYVIVVIFNFLKVGGKFFLDILGAVEFFLYFFLGWIFKNDFIFFKEQMGGLAYFLTLFVWFNILLIWVSELYCLWCFYQPYIQYLYEVCFVSDIKTWSDVEFVVLNPFEVYVIFLFDLIYMVRHIFVVIIEHSLFFYLRNRWFLYFFLIHYPDEFDFV